MMSLKLHVLPCQAPQTTRVTCSFLPFPPLSSRPTILTLVPNFHDPHSANSMKPILDEELACLAGWPSATRPRSFRTSILSQPIYLNQHLNQPWNPGSLSPRADLRRDKNRFWP